MHIFLTLLVWIIALVWTHRALTAARNLPRVPNLTALETPSCLRDPLLCEKGGDLAPCLTVIVPARNEAASIDATLRSLLAQTIPVSILAVNDRSTDATGAIMDSLSAGIAAEAPLSEPRTPAHNLRVLHIDRLPDGWMGKPHAMAVAARQATTEWLLFTDADVLFAPDTLARALRFARAASADHLVLLPTLILKTAGERMMAAIFYALSLLAWRPWKMADPRARRDFTGIGAFNLIRAAVYRDIGGFDAHPMEVVEDVRLGFLVKRSGYRLHMAFGRGLVSLHWAPGAFGMVRNLTKNIFSIFRFSPFLLLAACIGLAILGYGPLAALFAPGIPSPWPLRAAGLVALAMIALLYRLSSRYFSGISARCVLTFPVALALVLYAMLRSMIVTLARGGVTWRGTFYPLKELRRHAAPLR